MYEINSGLCAIAERLGQQQLNLNINERNLWRGRASRVKISAKDWFAHELNAVIVGK